MAKKTVSTYQHQLDWFLDGSNDDGTVAAIARKLAAEPFAEDSFRTELVAKLKRLKYQPDKLTGNEKTFYAILSEAGLLKMLLKSSTLRELWKCILLKKIVERVRKLEVEKKASDEQPLRFHKERDQQIRKDLAAIKEIAERYDAWEEVEELCEKLYGAGTVHLKILLACTKYRVPPSVLLSGNLPEGVRYAARDEDPATKKAIYRALKAKLQTAANRKKGVSDRFLYQLAELVWARPDVQRLTDAQIPYRDLKL